MKWNMMIGSLVLGLGLCTQSFGFELLDRMLGVSRGCGCDAKCGAEVACQQPVCCPAPAPVCPDPCDPCAHSRGGLLDRLLAHRCQPACPPCVKQPVCHAPKVACPPPCPDPCAVACKPRRSILDRLFACPSRCAPACEPVCGAGHIHGGHLNGDAAPMPPAPVVDPSAFVPSQRRVVRTSHALTR